MFLWYLRLCLFLLYLRLCLLGNRFLQDFYWLCHFDRLLKTFLHFSRLLFRLLLRFRNTWSCNLYCLWDLLLKLLLNFLLRLLLISLFFFGFIFFLILNWLFRLFLRFRDTWSLNLYCFWDLLLNMLLNFLFRLFLINLFLFRFIFFSILNWPFSRISNLVLSHWRWERGKLIFNRESSQFVRFSNCLNKINFILFLSFSVLLRSCLNFGSFLDIFWCFFFDFWLFLNSDITFCWQGAFCSCFLFCRFLLIFLLVSSGHILSKKVQSTNNILPYK